MTAIHTGALDHALADALHHNALPHASTVSFQVLTRAEDGTPTFFRATAWDGPNFWDGEDADKVVALAAAMTGLRAATGGA